VGALSSPSLSDWVLPFGADGSGGPPPVAIVLTHGVLAQGVSGLAWWPRPLGLSSCTTDVCGVQSLLCGALQNGMGARLADIPLSK